MSAERSIEGAIEGAAERAPEAWADMPPPPARPLVDVVADAPGPRRGARIARHLAEAVAELHARGGVHGALCPAVIAIGRQDRVTLVRPAEPLTRTDALRYAAPEVARGGAPTAAADVFSLALLARELMEGEPPRPSSGEDVAIDAVDGRVTVPGALGEELRALALLSVSQHADQRPSATDWVDALRREVRGRRGPRREWILLSVGTVAAAAAIAAFVVSLRSSVRAEDRTSLQYEDARAAIQAFVDGSFHELDRVQDLDALADAGEHALAAIERVPEDERDARDRELYARMLLWNGRAKRVRGSLDEAQELLGRAAASVGDVDDPDSAAEIELLAVTSLGEMAREARELVAARDHFRRALEIGEAQFEGARSDRDLRIAYAYSLMRFGDLSMSTGKQSAKRSIQIYRRARGILDDPDSGLDPDDREALELRAELDKLEATMAWQNGKPGRAIGLLTSHVERAQRLIEVDPGLPRLRWMLARGANVKARVQRDVGLLGPAVESLRVSVEAWRLLREMEPDRSEWRREWARSVRLLADALARVGEWQESAALHDVSVEVMEAMLADGTLPKTARLEIGTQLLDAAEGQLAAGHLKRSRALWKRAKPRIGKGTPSKRQRRSWFMASARARVVEAELLLAEGRWPRAEARALEFLQEIQDHAARGEDVTLRRETARAMLVVSSVRALDGQVEVARDVRERALAIADELLEESVSEPSSLALRARILFALGLDEEVAEALELLDRFGYRDLQLAAVRAATGASNR
ncbi:MAG: hypothetical protein AAGB93_05045 [Planctomycetota bacterium]